MQRCHGNQGLKVGHRVISKYSSIKHFAVIQVKQILFVNKNEIKIKTRFSSLLLGYKKVANFITNRIEQILS